MAWGPGGLSLDHWFRFEQREWSAERQ